jgi:PAS domain S-box-containing protein
MGNRRSSPQGGGKGKHTFTVHLPVIARGKMDSLKDLIHENLKIPSPPSNALRLLETLKKEDYSICEVSRVIKSDPALAAKVLRAANSEIYALPVKATSIERALAILGSHVVKNIALSFNLRQDRSDTLRVGFGRLLLSRGMLLLKEEEKQKRVEEALKEEHRRLQQIIDFLPDPTLVIDGTGRVTAWNRAIERITGVRAEEMIGKGEYAYAVPFYGERRPILVDLALLPDEAFLSGHYDDLSRQDSTLSAEVFVPKTYGGKGAYLWATASKLLDADGNVIGAIESIHDITKRKSLEKALQQSEEKYRRIVDTANEGIWVVGADSTISFANARMAEMLDCSEEEMIGRLFTDFMIDEDVPDHLQKMDNRHKGISENYERWFLRKDGQTMWTHVSAAPIFDAEHLFKGSFAMFTDITERKRMENVLRESEERFRILTEKSFVGMYIIQDDLFRYVNPAFADIFGCTPEEIIDRLSPTDFITPEDRERVLDSIRRRTAGEIEFSHHGFHISRKDGSIRVVETFGSRASHYGRPAIIGTIIDITERKRAEDNLFQVTERWERTFDAVPDLIAIIDTNFRIVQANKAMADRLGATQAECAGQVCYAAVHKSESPPSFCPHAQTLTDCHEHMCEVREECLGGDFIVSTSPIYDSAGQLMGSVHVARDITERKHAETKLNEQLHFLQQLLDNIPIPVFYKDVDGLYLGCNLAFERFIGLSRSDIVGKTVYEVSHKERADKYNEADTDLLRQPGVQVYEASVIYNDGECHNVIFNKATFVDANNCVSGVVGAMIDITSLRKAEEERKMLEAQLHQAQKMEAIGQLAGGIAHDFNNILTAIMGYTAMVLLKMEKGNPFRRHLEQILASSERAAELTHGLLAFSRKQVLHAKPIDLCGVVRSLKKMMGRLVPEDIDFRTTVAEGDLIVMADKGQIEQVLMNLVTNAKDSMPMGGTLTIEVSPAVMEERFVHAHGFGEPGDYACVTVADTGQGMDEETRKRIFEPFFTTKEVGKGTGLGMSIIYGIIQQHNGYVSVYSEKEMGTTFKIYLPLIAEGIKEVHGTREAEPPPGGTETVLLAEDDATVLELHRMILEEAGYRVIEAVDGQDALDKFTEHRTEVDILATDVIMPKMNGKGLYEEIRKIRPNMKVLFMSGYTKDIIVERGILEDEFSVITKPVTSYELLKKVREILDWNRL